MIGDKLLITDYHRQGAIQAMETIRPRLAAGVTVTVTVAGESGSGKSTLARVVTGLLPPLQGKVVFEGKELPPALKSRDRESLRQVQMIYQMPDTALNPRHKVRKVIGRPLSFYFHMKGKDGTDKGDQDKHNSEDPAQGVHPVQQKLQAGLFHLQYSKMELAIIHIHQLECCVIGRINFWQA